MLKLNNSRGGSIEIKPEDTLSTDEVLNLESLELNQGIEVQTLNGLIPDEYMRDGINTTTQGIITQAKRPRFWGILNGFAYARANYVATITETTSESSNGFIIDNNRIYPQTAGTYYFQAGQLIKTSGVTAYMYLRKNGTSLVWGYSNSDDNFDIKCNAIIEMEVGDYLDIYYSGTTSYSWGAPHSNIECFLIT